MRTVEAGMPETARRFAALLRTERFEESVGLFAPALRAALPAEQLRLAWATEVAGRGGRAAVEEPVAEAGSARVRIPVLCAEGGFAVVTSVGDDGLLQGLRFDTQGDAAWEPPGYVDEGRFTECDVVVGTGPLAVPGTLTLPVGEGPWPAVVLLSGGGAFDRDETIGANKPLKDLAWGLASRRVAVLRFDKVTFAHPDRLPPDFTMADEYVPHALAAVRLLRERPEVAPDRIHLLGHSMGGKAAPRIAAADPSIAGLVLLAADTQPMHEAAVRVARHLARLAPGPAADAMVATLARQAAAVADPGLTPDAPPESLPLGFSASYWLDLRGYEPAATAAGLERPMLILQGGRDYQVTVADDLPGWRRALAGRPEVSIRVHEHLDHLFFAGSGASTPADYARPGHVDPAVVDEVARWLTRHEAP
ncbi:alpha/beta hydrolase family protein [Streptomyces sp. NPDC086838]|uniref:alpha/beta hydrolase family protein n=1 Tax=Streptomyces sp. NPDC086838 TaxID=3365762 RepID=UPI00382185F3